MHKSIMALGVAFAVATCGSVTDSAPPPDILFSLGEEFTLELGQRGAVADSSIGLRFTNVPTESRCPADVVCVWEGYAETAIQVTTNSGNTLSVLSTHPSVCCTEDSVDGFVVELRDLIPVPRSTDQDAIRYEVRLLVTAR